MPPKIDEIHFSTYTCLYLFVYTLSVITYFTGNLFSIIFFNFSIDDFVLLGAILLCSGVSAILVRALKCLVDLVHVKLKIAKFEQCRNEILIGLGGIAVCGVVPRILVYFVEHNEFNAFFYLNLFIITAIIFGFVFVNQHNSDYCTTYHLNDRTSWGLIIAHSIIFSLLAAQSTVYLPNWQWVTVVILCHTSFFVMCTSSTIEIFKILRGDMKLSEEKNKIEFFGIYGLWKKLKNLKFSRKHPKIPQKSETWPDITVDHGNIGIFKKEENGLGDDDGTITVMTRWTAPTLEAIPGSPEPREEEVENEQSPPEQITSSQRTVQFTD